jgi:hypothetical protein
MLAGLDETADREAFRTLLQRLSMHAATALDSTSADPCTADCQHRTPPARDPARSAASAGPQRPAFLHCRLLAPSSTPQARQSHPSLYSNLNE